ncbi:MAG: menaquinone-dependent protoporphyrinogen IX dehydrogenase [Gammaproteobacteria bacterium]|nr:menaquinone-dependent protoporphyrinogen IX dehydrogenase [Gammaproteobacteria bacterium]MBT8111913.1 menaquinone-dependent protoporphyrinogen IX dehydrogenase [Gammaproteobacteria bacterium]NND47932.1 menaquinone-dependent protoporphyrinogen IX dehydrogenase [Woeseiaceae bacterium]NNL46612.1 menaquinone-dependent protoporphyrinogen IX dehydrogenase [Woeseiaceae bacterium]
MAKVLILYSTTDGHTIEICKRIKQTIETSGYRVQLQDLKDEPELVPGTFDKVVIGASIRYGKHQPLVGEFIKENQTTLEGYPNAFFSVNVVARKPEKNRPETNPYLQKFLQKIDWEPQQLGVFAGKIDYPSLGFVDKQMIRLIMWITKGPTDPNSIVEFTDWDKVDEFGRMVAEM